MKCFTVSDKVTKGIIVKGEPLLRIGAKGFCSEIPLCKSLAKSFEALAAIGEDELAMTKADISTNKPLRLLPEKAIITRWNRRIESDTALVHVTTKSSGQLWFEANCYDQEVVPTKYSKRVRRAYHPFQGGDGVDVLAIGTGANGEPNALLRMIPGASFRICRDTLDLPPELLVVWTGIKLRFIVPEKHRKKQQKQRREATRKG